MIGVPRATRDAVQSSKRQPSALTQVTVTFSQPVKAACSPGSARLYWTRASFSWPDGLPAALSGQNAPLNPFTYPEIGGNGACG